MNLILIGAEYSGTTTLATKIAEWGTNTLGGQHGFHDHWKIPYLGHSEFTDEEYQSIVNLTPNVKEQYQRYHMEYHLSHSFYEDTDHNMVGFCYDEAVYAPLYYGYGGEGEYAGRSWYARHMEQTIKSIAPNTVLILLKCSPDEIRKRMKKNPNKYGILKDKDVEHVLERFEEEYNLALIRQKITLDSTNTSPNKLVKEFEKQIEPFLTDVDRQRIIFRSLRSLNKQKKSS